MGTRPATARLAELIVLRLQMRSPLHDVAARFDNSRISANTTQMVLIAKDARKP